MAAIRLFTVALKRVGGVERAASRDAISLKLNCSVACCTCISVLDFRK
jgi:hypothetical protein